MYKTLPLVFGFHGCDADTVKKVINKKIDLTASHNGYDWLGHGIYFWENDPKRAFEWATFLSKNPKYSKRKIKKPAVVGAIIDLGYCFNLVEREHLQTLKYQHSFFTSLSKGSKYPIPSNTNVVSKNRDLLKRYLDCAVIEFNHFYNEKLKELKPYDTVRGVFWEGKELYPNAGFKENNHIQICVRNPNCIKGFFYPRDFNEKHSRP